MRARMLNSMTSLRLYEAVATCQAAPWPAPCMLSLTRQRARKQESEEARILVWLLVESFHCTCKTFASALGFRSVCDLQRSLSTCSSRRHCGCHCQLTCRSYLVRSWLWTVQESMAGDLCCKHCSADLRYAHLWLECLTTIQRNFNLVIGAVTRLRSDPAIWVGAPGRTHKGRVVGRQRCCGNLGRECIER